MNSEIRDFIRRSEFYQATVRELAGMLPADNAALDGLLGKAVAASDDVEFLFLANAAFYAGRPVQARHLAYGTVLMQDKHMLGLVALHMEGDIATPLLEAVTERRLQTVEQVSTSLYLAAKWQQEHGGKISAKLTGAARTAARNKNNTPYDLALLMNIAVMGNDEGVRALLLERHGFKPDDPRIEHVDGTARQLAEQMCKIWQTPPFELVPEGPRKVLATGNTMRRAVARIGRNEPCPCGSGRKYKHCCQTKDERTLHHSTSIAGVTDAEMRANPERYLTTVGLDTMSTIEAARMDPMKVPAELREAYLANLCRAKYFDTCVSAFEKFGYNEKLEEAWDNITLRLAQAQKKELVDRMMKVRPDAVNTTRHGGIRMLLAEDDPASFVQLIHEGALTLLSENRMDELPGFTRTLLNSRLCALGILVARGVIPIIPPTEAAGLLDELLRARDRMSLSPDDAISDVLDKLSVEQRDDDKDAEALREAQARLDEKMQEVQRYRESVSRLEKELARREKLAAAPAPAPATPATPVDEAALKELRHKVDELKESLKERHNERNELRRELQKAQNDLETLRKNATPSAATSVADEADHEEDLLLPQDAPEVHPVRLIEFPRGFQNALEGIPRHIARATVIMIGRLASGEPAAFVGALRLKQVPNVMRQRIGSDFRLLFRLHADHLQVIDLINRKDLLRRLKTL